MINDGNPITIEHEDKFVLDLVDSITLNHTCVFIKHNEYTEVNMLNLEMIIRKVIGRNK